MVACFQACYKPGDNISCSKKQFDLLKSVRPAGSWFVAGPRWSRAKDQLEIARKWLPCSKPAEDFFFLHKSA